MILAALASGCAGERGAIVPLGSEEQTVKKELGEPAKIAEPTSRPAAKVWEYNDGTRFQIEKGKVVVKTRKPLPHETTLQYWRHLWKGEPKLEAPIESTADQHGPTEGELNATRLRMSVIYNLQSSRVIEVNEYGEK